jgi:hypothetical protein
VIPTAAKPERSIFVNFFGYDGSITLRSMEWIAVDSSPDGRSQTVLKGTINPNQSSSSSEICPLGSDSITVPTFQVNSQPYTPENRMFLDSTLVRPGDSAAVDVGPNTWIWY